MGIRGGGWSAPQLQEEIMGCETWPEVLTHALRRREQMDETTVDGSKNRVLQDVTPRLCYLWVLQKNENFWKIRKNKKKSKKQIRKNWKKSKKIDEFGGFGPGNKLLRRFGGIPSKNRRNRCLGGDFLGQNKFWFFVFFRKNRGQTADVYIYILAP